MSWIADLHIHSRYSVATSKECDPYNLYRWAGLKGLSLIGTGDFTHPGWRNRLREELIPGEPGFYRLKEPPAPEIPGQPEPRFVVSGELSTIYKKNGRVRKVHHLIVLPSLEAADKISGRLEELGMNIRSDGRPILGLDSYNLFEMVLNVCPEVIYIPAHIWTPHFSVFGSNSGFESIEECFEDLTPHIYALETGLSSDPGMNWRWSALDRFTLVSNSDAHNPKNLAREANIFNSEFTYSAMQEALRNKESHGFQGTIEFFPEEGKYHYDGHRGCEVSLTPEETKNRGCLCPVCGRKVTVGVLHRLIDLADRPEGTEPPRAIPYQSLVPLCEIIGSGLNQGSGTRKVDQIYNELLHKFGPELHILREVEIDAIASEAGPLIAEGIRRLRAGEVMIKPGYDGEYGVISLFSESDRQALKGQAALFESETVRPKKETILRQAVSEIVGEAKKFVAGTEFAAPNTLAGVAAGLSSEQLAVISADYRYASIIAGPGSGKTRTLTERIAYLIRNQGVDPGEITGVTFTNRAAAELKNRLSSILAGEKRVQRLNLGTFHSIAWEILHQNPTPFDGKLLDAAESKSLVEEVLRQNRIPMTAKEASLIISLMKNKYLWEEDFNLPAAVRELYQAYQENLAIYDRMDFDDVIIKAVELWRENPAWLTPLKNRFRHLFVDEFQDINSIQYQLIRLWADGNSSLTVIGDPNQAIYGFRGASAAFFEHLDRDFPEASSYKLDVNYRSAPVVVKTANVFVKSRYHQTFPTGALENHDLITWLQTPNEWTAAKSITSEIIDLLGGSTMISAHRQKAGSRRGGKNDAVTYGFSDFAILYRTNRQVQALEEALAIEGLPYRVVGQITTFENAAVKEFLGFFRYLCNVDDLFALRSAISFPRWGFNGAELNEIITLLRRNKQLLLEKTGDLEINSNYPEITIKLHQFYGVVDYYRVQMNRPSPEIVQDWMLRMDLAENEELEHLKRISENYRNLEDLIKFLPLAQEADIFRRGDKTTGTETITLSTLHAAKGLEFPVVFLAGVEEGLLPFGKEPDQDTIDEEQRLFYVGVTRAKHRLYLINSQYRLQNGRNEPVAVSRFLQRIPAEFLEKTEWVKLRDRQKQLELF